jgi:hypothetical protein
MREEHMNCWEFKNCKKEVYEACPAYPAKGLDCWKVSGTKCDGGKYEKATLQEKIHFCRSSCEFYKTTAHKY